MNGVGKVSHVDDPHKDAYHSDHLDGAVGVALSEWMHDTANVTKHTSDIVEAHCYVVTTGE